MISYYIAALLLAAAFWTDVRTRRIPNWLTISGIAAGLLLQACSEGWAGFGQASMGLLTGGFPVLLLYLIKAVGAGDVKLFAAIGALTSPLIVISMLSASLLIAGVEAVIIMLWRRELTVRLFGAGLTVVRVISGKEIGLLLPKGGHRNKETNLHFPFMWAVFPGAVYTWWHWV